MISQTSALKNKVCSKWNAYVGYTVRIWPAANPPSPNYFLPESHIPPVLFQQWEKTTIKLLIFYRKKIIKQNNQISVIKASAHWMNYLRSYLKFILNRIMKISSCLIEEVSHGSTVPVCMHVCICTTW